MKTKRAKIDPMITMINVVFLLIAFFMVGQLQQPIPISVTLPISKGLNETSLLEPIFIDETGKIYFHDLVDGDAIKLAAKKHTEMQIHADENAPANLVIAAWKRILDAGIVIGDIGVQK